MRRSCVYEARLLHVRARPIAHRFEYPVWHLLLDLDELDALDGELRLFSHNRRNLVALHDRDHALAGARGLRAAALDFLRAGGVPVGDGDGWRFELLTHARVLGYVFNPVTFTYCHAPDGTLAAVIAEVRNTFGKVHRYLLDERARVPAARGHAYDADKLLHVSPFFDLELGYRFHFRELGERLELAMDVRPPGGAAGDPLFHVRLTGVRRPLTDATLAQLCLRYPLSTLQVIGRIHWQALRLWLRGASFHAEPPYDPAAARRRHDRPASLTRAARRGAARDHAAGAQAGPGRARTAP